MYQSTLRSDVLDLLTAHGVYDYATGDFVFDYYPDISFYGRCVRELLTPGKGRYVCENDWRGLEDAERMCHLSVATVTSA